MEKIFCGIFLLTGFCTIPASSTEYFYFIQKNMTFIEAFHHCSSRYDSFPAVDSWSKNNFFRETAIDKTDKVWLGLVASTSLWKGMDEKVAEYFNWKDGEPNGWNNELCALMESNGEWLDQNCSLHRQSVCSNESHYSLTETEMTWMDAAAHCEDRGSSLVQILNTQTNNKITDLVSHEMGAWIGLSKSVKWFWDSTGQRATFLNWQEGQPDNLHRDERCAAMVAKDGSWTDERCDQKYYFFCKAQRITSGERDSGEEKDETKAQKSKQMVVKLKIQTTANMEDPGVSAGLEQQLRAMLAKQGMTDFKLTWRKLPQKETQNKGKGAS